MSTRWHRHKKILEETKGYVGQANSCFRTAVRRWQKGQQYAYRDRKTKKRTIRQLWIQRMGASTRQEGLPYSRFIQGLNDTGIELNRKVLADIAVTEPFSFKSILEVVKTTPSINKFLPKQKESMIDMQEIQKALRSIEIKN